MHELYEPVLPELHIDNFYRNINTTPYAVIHFYAKWNQYDKTFGELVQGVSNQFPSIQFYSYDIDPEYGWHICRACQIMTNPSLAYFRNGQWIETVSKVHSEEGLRDLFSKWLHAETE